MTDYAKMTPISNDFSVVESFVSLTKTLSPPKYIDLTGIIPAPDIGWFYDEVNFTEELPAGYTSTSRKIESGLFWFGRIENDERGKIFALAQQDGGGITLTIIQRGRLKALLAFTIANEVSLDHPEVIFIFNALETAGAIDPGRAAEILG